MDKKGIVPVPPVGEEGTPLTAKEFMEVLPTHMHKTINGTVVDKINKTMSDSLLLSNFKDNIISYTSVLTDKHYTINQYLDAVKYVSYKQMGYTNKESYIRTHPERYKKLLAKNYSNKDINSVVYQYNVGHMVNNIFAMTIIPTHILNAPVYQEAINVQADLMRNARSETVRQKAADSLIANLKAPEVAKMELSVKTTEDDSIKALRETTLELARQQRLMIEAGASNVADIARSKLVMDVGDVEEGQISE